MTNQRRVPAPRWAYALLVFLAIAGRPAAAGQAFIDDDLQGLLAAAGSGPVTVLVALDPPPAVRGRAADIQARRTAVRNAGDRVLAALPAGRVQVLRRWSSVAGLVLSVERDLLPVLAAQPDVRRLGSEPGPGRGSLAEAAPLVGLDTLREWPGSDGAGRRVAVLDSGIDTDHPDLAGRIIGQKCFAEAGTACPGGPDAAEDDVGHGTAVAAVIAGAGVVAPPGGAPGTELFAVKVLDSNNSFSQAIFVIDGLDFVLGSGIQFDAVNMSLGTFATFEGDCDDVYTFTQLMADAIDTLRELGTLTVVAAGNQGNAVRMQAPACIANAIAVGASHDGGPQFDSPCGNGVLPVDTPACYTNASVTTDVFAPGSEILSADLGGDVALFNGTSFAAPLVSACVAALRAIEPGLSSDAIEAAIEHAATAQISLGEQVYPRLDCLAAAAPLLPAGDLDADGIADSLDNCPNVANPDQSDGDDDGIGNRCDTDLNNDCIVNAVDLGQLRRLLFSDNVLADFNAGGIVNSVDLGILKSYFFRPPGPGLPDSLCAVGVATRGLGTR